MSTPASKMFKVFADCRRCGFGSAPERVEVPVQAFHGGRDESGLGSGLRGDSEHEERKHIVEILERKGILRLDSQDDGDPF